MAENGRIAPARVIGTLSGGVGSYSAVRRYVTDHGPKNLTLVFTDTLTEDQDAYRFLIAGAANLTGTRLPAGFLPEISDFPAWEDRDSYKRFIGELANRAMEAIPKLAWLSDGRDVFDVYTDERFLGNSSVDPCSKILKRQLSDRWIKANFDKAETAIIYGIDYEEQHRFDDGKGHGIRPRQAEKGWTALAPLCDSPFISWQCRLDQLSPEGLWLPRLNKLGFAHNNCGGFCCKAGQGHWKLMLKVFPERYAYSERREQELRVLLGNVSMLTDRRGNGVKKPLPLSVLRTRDFTPSEASDMGGCGCFSQEDKEPDIPDWLRLDSDPLPDFLL